MSDEKSSPNWGVIVVQLIGVVLIVWSVVTLISGLGFADVGAEIEGRTFAFEDTGISGYGTYAVLGGILGVVLLVIAYFISKRDQV